MRRRFRPVRLGLWLGAIVGACYLASRLMRAKEEAERGGDDGWSAVPTRLEPVAMRAEPPGAPDAEPASAVEAPVVTTPEVADGPPPAKEAAPSKKAAAKKKAPAKKAAAKKAAAKKAPVKKAPPQNSPPAEG
jgi:hypothetical protein